ncbi:hypothetical protein LTR36_004387 [Oleoguttula mirabilis]|uniref:feruloyl esterase n=1 Tax=Oleoguttula mirabilis TaxID=1507867 RepID=A0AAV9JH69_9PEZI|nr:hypothetical protein LTR36_004387 [Oleoguttula mirabilis]
MHPSQRHAILHVPDDYDGQSPVPLIVGLHGKAQPPNEFAEHTQFSTSTFKGLVVYPEGIKLQWTGDPESPPRKVIDDIAFINVLIDQLQNDYSIDASRIYVAGFSNGGGLAALLAGDPKASGRIAAFAISSGAFYKDEALKEPLFSRCHPSRLPVPILEFHGDSDPVIHYVGKTTPDGPSYPVWDWVTEWAKRNTGTAENTRTSLYDGKVEKYSFASDDGNEVLVHYYIHGFGHGWPTKRPLNNDEQRHGPTYFDATPIVLDFFSRFAIHKGGL